MEGVEQLLCVCNDLGRHVQGCESLYGKYDEYWTPGMADAWDDPGIQTDIRRTIHRVLRDASEDTITAIQQNINPKTIKILAHNLTSRYRHLFHRNNDYLTLPDDLPPGRYNIWAGMYAYPSLDNLTVLSAGAPTDGKRVLVTQIEVLAP